MVLAADSYGHYDSSFGGDSLLLCFYHATRSKNRKKCFTEVGTQNTKKHKQEKATAQSAELRLNCLNGLLAEYNFRECHLLFFSVIYFIF